MFYLFAVRNWPDGIDSTVTAVCLAIILGFPVAGYIFMVIDFRAYLRTLKRAMVVARGYLLELPDWVRKETPQCLIALDLKMPCDEEDILAAYRKKVKQLHPDRGGDRRAFLKLQQHFEQALRFVQ